MISKLEYYSENIGGLLKSVEVTDASGHPIGQSESIQRVIESLEEIRHAGGKNIFIGNGGSAAIASHMAIDYSKNGRLPSQAFNDGAALTCLGNDLGYENVFAEQVKLFAKPEDQLFAISSSGASPNILGAVSEGRRVGCRVVTLSGFKRDNPLRRMGDLNWYVNSSEYGLVEISHLVICHAILDYQMGWDGTEIRAKDLV